MRRHLLPLVFTGLLTACGGTGGGGQPTLDLPPGADEDIGEIVATVSGFPVGAREFEAVASREVPANGESFTEEEKRAILERIVEEKMLYLHARALGVDRDLKVQKVMINTLLRERVYAEVRNSDFTEEELRAYFDAHLDEFVVPEKVQVLRLFIRSGRDRTAEEAAALAEDLYLRIQADPTQFKAIAAEHSEDPYRRRGGDLGFMSREGKPGIDPLVVEKAFELDVDQISPPFEAGDGYNIVMVAARRARVERTFAQMKGAVLRKVKAERYRELYEQYVDQIDDAFEISYAEGALEGIDPRPARRSPLGAPGGLRPRGLTGEPGEDEDGADEGTMEPAE
jgi:parvulin-like peptidyl-prolyl isomerase